MRYYVEIRKEDDGYAIYRGDVLLDACYPSKALALRMAVKLYLSTRKGVEVKDLNKVTLLTDDINSHSDVKDALFFYEADLPLRDGYGVRTTRTATKGVEEYYIGE